MTTCRDYINPRHSHLCADDVHNTLLITVVDHLNIFHRLRYLKKKEVNIDQFVSRHIHKA